MRSPERSKVIVTTGHTGGHFFPALSVLEAFSTHYPDIELHLVMNRVSDFAKTALQDLPVQVHPIPMVPPSRLFSLKLPFVLLEYVLSFLKVARLLSELKPKAVIGFGSYSTVPTIIFAAAFNIPVLIHEQNFIAGKANQFLAYWANSVAVSFPGTVGLKGRLVFQSGYPLRKRFDVLAGKGLEKSASEPFTILMFGGSQGAASLNRIFLQAMALLSPEEKKHFAVIHITGDETFEEVLREYKALNILAETRSFSQAIELDFQKADLIVSRAGAGTIFELAAVGRASILIPYPHAYGHQEWNARYLADRGWAKMILEKKLDAASLLREIRWFRNEVNLRKQIELGIRKLIIPNAAQILAETAWKL